MPIFKLALVSVFYYASHSALASQRVKNWVAQKFPSLLSIYRLTYNLLAILGLLCIAWIYHQTPGKNFFELGLWGKSLGGILIILGAVMAALALKGYDWQAFLGTKQLPAQQIDPSEPLVVTGLNAWVRHPLYTATILVLVGALIGSPKPSTLTVVFISLLYLRIGIYWEEKKLLERYGEAYERYRKGVAMLIPRFWKQK